jgi:hypothetical protein
MDNQTEETWTWRQQKPRPKTKAATAEFEGLRKLRQNMQKKKVQDPKKKTQQKMEINKRAPETVTKP